MNRYEKTFNSLQQNKKIAFVPFWMIGYPSLDESYKIINEIAKKSDILELGFPFSDPLADGPIIQETVNTALENGANTKKCFDIVQKIRFDFPEKPIGLLVYFNLILSYGIQNFFRKMSDIGIDSIIIPEIPIEEIYSKIESEYSILELSKKYNIALIFLVSTNTPKNRLEKICSVASSFIYVISSPTVTGSKVDIDDKLKNTISKIKSNTPVPICVGFGISSPDDVEKIKSFGADGAIIGSKIIKLYRDNGLSDSISFIKDISSSL